MLIKVDEEATLNVSQITAVYIKKQRRPFLPLFIFPYYSFHVHYINEKLDTDLSYCAASERYTREEALSIKTRFMRRYEEQRGIRG